VPRERERRTNIDTQEVVGELEPDADRDDRVDGDQIVGVSDHGRAVRATEVIEQKGAKVHEHSQDGSSKKCDL
jgi:hypothetical protein